MNMNIRKLGATLLGATMAGAAFMAPALAASDLQDYPAPFVQDGNTNFLIVVGAAANPADIVGAINVAVRLGAERGEDVSCTGGSAVISGGEDKELALNEAFSTFGTMKYNKLAGYQHGKIRWNSKDVDIDEELNVDGLKFVTSINDKDLGSDVFLGTGSSNYADFKYSFVIDDGDFDYTLVNDSASKKLSIKFLGTDKNLEIIGVTNASSDQITFKFATDVVLGVGETATVEGTTMKVNSIGSGSASVTVGGDTKIISSGDEYDFGSLKVSVNSILYTDDVASRQVDLSVGSDIEKTVTDGDSMETFGEPEDANDAEWVWSIVADNSDTSKLTIGAKYNQKLLDHKDDLKKIGQYFNLPNNYSRVSINSFSTEDYATIKGDFDTFIDLDKLEVGTDTTAYTDKSGFVLTSNKADTGFRVYVQSAWIETDKVYLLQNDSDTVIGAYDDADNKKRIFFLGNNTDYQVTDQLQVYYQDTTKAVYFNNNPAAMALTIVEGVEGDIVWDVDATNAQLGGTSGTAETGELTINGTSRGTVEEDYRTFYGFIVRDPKSNGDSDQLEIAVPSEQLKATVLVEGPGTSVTQGAGTTVKKAVPIVDNIARLDTDSGVEAAKLSKNLILVGGPAVNKLTAEALGVSFPSYGADSTIPEGAAIIKLVDNAFTTGKTALVVAGWDAENTRAACSVLQQFSTYADLTGTGVKVSGTTTPTLAPLTE